MNKTDRDAQFDFDYFENRCGAIPMDRSFAIWQDHYSRAARNIVEIFQPRRVLDVGCAKGFLVEQLRDLGVEAYGLDVSSYAISEVREDMREFCRVADATEPLREKYDLITCIDVAQHLPEEEAVLLVRNLCEHSNEVIFSVPDDHTDPTHLNVRPAEFWLGLFCDSGFFPVLRGGPDYLGARALHFRKVTRKIQVAVFSREREEWAVVRLRLLDPLRELERMGRLEVTFVSSSDGSVPIEKLMDADVFVIHREFADRKLEDGIIEAARLLMKPIVFEIDDLVTNLPRSNRLWEYCTSVTPDVLAALEEADFVTASTPTLLEELRKDVPSIEDKSRVMRNVVDTEVWGSSFRARDVRPGEPLVVGWFGSATHDEDLGIVKEAIAYLTRKHRGKIEFHFFGYVPEELSDLDGVRLARGLVGDVEKHAKSVRSATIHLAIAPLTDHTFNLCKSDLKWLEYSICGIPGIYSNVTPYSSSIQDRVTGLLVENETAAWVDAIEEMMRNHALRTSIGKNAFDVVRSCYCVDVTAGRWDELYRSIVATGPTAWAEVSGDEAAGRAAACLFQFQARQQARKGNLGGAAISLEAAMNLDSSCVEEVASAAVRLADQGELAAAEKLLQAVIREAPQHADAHLWLARLHDMLGDTVRTEAALCAAEQWHAADPDLAKLHVEHLQQTGQEARVEDRLRTLVAAEHHPEEAVSVAEMLVGMGQTELALSVIDSASQAFPEVNFTQLRSALSRAAKAGMILDEVAPPVSGAIRVAVFTRQHISSPRVQLRLRSPLRVLERAAMADVRWSDGEIGQDSLDWADLVVIHRDFAAREWAEPVVERARARKLPVVFETDDLAYEQLALKSDQAAAKLRDDFGWIIGEADLTTVATAALKHVLAELQPAASERIVVLETPFDLEIWPSTQIWQKPKGRPFNIGVFTDWASPGEATKIIEALAPFVTRKDSEVTLSTWSPFTAHGAPLPNSSSVGSATPFYLEYARRLSNAPIDLALVPVSNSLYHITQSDIVWAELGACRIPALFSAMEPFASTVIQGQTGILLGDDPRVWASTVERMVDAHDLRQHIADRAWTIAFAERSVQTMAASWAELYRNILQPAEVEVPARV